jgi:hypothetical protein
MKSYLHPLLFTKYELIEVLLLLGESEKVLDMQNLKGV